MRLQLRRKDFGATWTIGELFVDGAFECYVLEDRVRPPGEKKVPGETAISVGTYEVLLKWSVTFGRIMPFLAHVVGFEGVEIHWGNTDRDTRGCLLVGMVPDYQRGKVLRSVDAFDALWAKLARAFAFAKERVIITITEDAPERRAA